MDQFWKDRNLKFNHMYDSLFLITMVTENYLYQQTIKNKCMICFKCRLCSRKPVARSKPGKLSYRLKQYVMSWQSTLSSSVIVFQTCEVLFYGVLKPSINNKSLISLKRNILVLLNCSKYSNCIDRLHGLKLFVIYVFFPMVRLGADGFGLVHEQLIYSRWASKNVLLLAYAIDQPDHTIHNYQKELFLKWRGQKLIIFRFTINTSVHILQYSCT